MEALYCLLCLKRVDNDERRYYNCFNEREAKGVSTDTLLYSKFLKFVREFLKIEGDDNPLFSKTCSVGLSHFCGCCESVLSTVCRLYSDLLEVQLRLSWKLGELGELLEGSEKRVSNKLWTVLIRLVARQLSFKGVVVESAHVNELRGSLKSKCAQKGKDNLPSVVVERISDVPIESFPRSGEVNGRGTFSVLWIAPNDDKTPQEGGNCSSISEAIFNRTTCPSNVENDDADIKVELESILGDDEDHFNSGCWEADATMDDHNEDEVNNARAESLSSPSSMRITRRRSQKIKGGNCDNDDSVSRTTKDNLNADNIKTEEHAEFDMDFDSTSENTFSENDSGSDWSESAADRKKSKTPKTTSRRPVSRRVKKSTTNKPDPDEDTTDLQECKSNKLKQHKIDNEDDDYLEQCEHCDKLFVSITNFNSHLRNMEYHTRLEKKYKCFFCYRSFAYQQSLQIHIRLNHQKTVNFIKPLFCSEHQCGQMFSTHTELNTHLESHSKTIHHCSTCGLGFLNDSHLQLHVLLHTDPSRNKALHIRRFPCLLCDTTFLNVEEYQVHYNVQHGSSLKFECPKCELHFDSYFSLSTHFKTIHVDENSQLNEATGSEEKQLKCDECENEFKNEYRLQSHNQNFHKCVKCNSCGLQFNGLITLRDHQTKVHLHETYFACPDCGREFSYLESMKRHMLVVHKRKAAENTSSSLVCEVCGKLSKNKLLLKRHSLCHKSKQEKGMEEKPICEICGRVCNDSRGLKFHMKVHEENTKELKCKFPSCTLTFSEKEIRQQHVERDHVPLKQYEFLCSSCGRALANKKVLQKHKKHLCSGKNYTCQLCPKSFNYKESLESHIINIHGIGNAAEYYSCEEPQCGRQFSKRFKLRLHMKAVHKIIINTTKDPKNQNSISSIHPIKCMFPSCSVTFQCKGKEKERQDHVEKEHLPGEGEYEFVCRFCGRVFINQERLDNHTRVHEEGKEKPWKCEKCPRSYFNKNTLDTHVKQVHKLKQKSFSCDQPNCGKICKSFDSLRKHRRSYHNLCKKKIIGKPILESDAKKSFEAN